MNSVHSQTVSLIWNIADDVLRDIFVRGQYRDVILPMVVLRRLDALLESTKVAVEEEMKLEKENGFDDLDEHAIKNITGLSYYNTSRWTLARLKQQATGDNDILYDNFAEYLNGFSKNVSDVLTKFEFFAKARKLADRDCLLPLIEKITDPFINLTDQPVKDPNGLTLPAVSNIDMGTIFEELLRRFNEENNEEAGEHFTPRDVIHLLSQMVFEPVLDDLPQIIQIYDPACGSGGMLTEASDYLISRGVAQDAIEISGTEINPETYAICKSDLIIKNVNPDGIHCGNTLTINHFANRTFGYMITNPPYGKSWKEDKKKIYHDKELTDSRFFLPLQQFDGETADVDCCTRTSDGQLMFVLEMLDKLKPLDVQPQGSRIASVHNGSALFTGDAGQAESDIRRYLLENDLVDVIIQLPNNISTTRASPPTAGYSPTRKSRSARAGCSSSTHRKPTRSSARTRATATAPSSLTAMRYCASIRSSASAKPLLTALCVARYSTPTSSATTPSPLSDRFDFAPSSTPNTSTT